MDRSAGARRQTGCTAQLCGVRHRCAEAKLVRTVVPLLFEGGEMERQILHQVGARVERQVRQLAVNGAEVELRR